MLLKAGQGQHQVGAGRARTAFLVSSFKFRRFSRGEHYENSRPIRWTLSMFNFWGLDYFREETFLTEESWRPDGRVTIRPTAVSAVFAPGTALMGPV